MFLLYLKNRSCDYLMGVEKGVEICIGKESGLVYACLRSIIL